MNVSSLFYNADWLVQLRLPVNETKKPRKIFRFVKSLLGIFYKLPIIESWNVIDQKISTKFNPFIFVLYYLLFIDSYYPRDNCSVTSSSEGAFHLIEERLARKKSINHRWYDAVVLWKTRELCTYLHAFRNRSHALKLLTRSAITW